MKEKKPIKPVVATKLSPEAEEQLSRIAKAKGMTKFELLRMVCDTIIRYMSDAHNLTPEIEKAMSIFEHMTNWADHFNFADPGIKKEVAQAVYILHDADQKKHGFRATMVSKPFCGDCEQTENVIDIFERLFNILMPELYLKLYKARILLECSRVTEVISMLVDAEIIEHMNEEYRREFEDAGRADNARRIGYGERTKVHPYRTPDSYAADGRLHFDDFDRSEGVGESTAAEPEDWRSHGVEW